jgi:hypothetical protein
VWASRTSVEKATGIPYAHSRASERAGYAYEMPTGKLVCVFGCPFESAYLRRKSSKLCVSPDPKTDAPGWPGQSARR